MSVSMLVVFMLACGRDGTSRQVIQNKGSDTLVNVAQAWAEAYGAVNPSLAVAVSGGGSGTGISAMINGTADIANSSRKMRDSEIEAARAQDHDPIEFVVGVDALAIFLHPDNPLSQVTIAQLAAIYGEGGGVDNWSDMGITVPGCSSGEVVRVSRQNNSGTYAYFQEAVLGEVEFKLGSRDMHGSKDVVDLVENTPCAIGYSGLAYATDHVKMPCVLSEDGACVAPSVDTAIDGSYPIARPLFMYTSGQPQGAVKEYMDWIMSDVGQCIVLEKGYAPVKPVTCA
jgi:phosphate transport system substrate-binding protein